MPLPPQLSSLFCAAIALTLAQGCSSRDVAAPQGSANSGPPGTSGSGGAQPAGGASPAGAGTGGAAVDAGGAAGFPVAGSGGTNASGGGAGGPPGKPVLYPAQGTLLGAFVGTGPASDFETMLGRKLSVRLSYYGWRDDFNAGATQEDIAAGRIPYVTWEPKEGDAGVSLDEIIAGAHDQLIRERALASKALGAPLLLRWAHEMNGDWYPWGGANNGGENGGPAKYVAAYRHIHDLFTSEGASNVQWVWCPMDAHSPWEPWNHFTNYYPGDDYVDWAGVDGYNWGATQPWGWNSFESIFREFYETYAGSGKPILIGETASTELGGDKAAWITDMHAAMKESFPAIKALVWFHIDKETDWRIDSSDSSKAAFLQLAGDPYFQ